MAGRSPSYPHSLTGSEFGGRGRSSSGSISGREERVVSRAPREANTTVNRKARYDGQALVQPRTKAHTTDQRFRPQYSTSPERDRSRSPWRPGKDKGFEKRRYEGDHYGKDVSGSRRSRALKVEPQRRTANGTKRERSRSPWRADRFRPESLSARDGHRPGSSKSHASSTDAASMAGEKDLERDPSFQRESAPTAPRDVLKAKIEPTRLATKLQGDSNDSIPVKEQASASSNSKGTGRPPDAGTASDQPSKPSDAELIEQRRKRREAIKAKHKSEPPLLVQALEQSIPSTVATPVHVKSGLSSDAQSPPSTTANSPRTPQDAPSPGSPAAFAFSTDEELVNVHQLGVECDVDEPSAADYDPNMDLYEDRPGHKQVEDSGSKPHDAANGILPPEPREPSTKSKELDMFAEDDDDFDMFAAQDPERLTADSTKVRALDEKLLDNWDYPDGHYRIIPAELLDGRYKVKGQIGKGTFATVVRATDSETGEDVAIKIARNNDTMYKAGMKEVGFLELLNEKDQDKKKHIIHLLRYFNHKNHLCLVFENLSNDLREILKKFGRNVGISLQAITVYAQQMFQALAHMKSCSVLHADLKPDNILVNDKRNYLKICDLGTATFERDAEITPYLVSRFYRAPEIILGIEFDYSIDMWSIGCTLYELYTGRILFPGANNNNMLRVIQECRGKFPNRLIKKASLANQYFDENFVFYSQEREKLTDKVIQRPLHFTKIEAGKDIRSRVLANSSKMSQSEIKDLQVFADLLDKCLQLDPERRITPRDALKHPFVQRSERGPVPTNAPVPKNVFTPLHPIRASK